MQRHDYITKCAGVLAIIALGSLATPWLRTTPARIQMGGRPAMAAGVGNESEAAVPRFPKLRTRASNPHLIEDENGKPFFMAGLCPQNIMHWCTPEQMETYFADRQRRHFNFAWVMITGWNLSNGVDMASPRPAENSVDASGNPMLLKGTSWYPQNLNPAYVASVDALLRSAAAHGIYLFLDPCNSAYDPKAEDFDPTRHSNDEMRAWGEFWGNRYKQYSNVNFALGSDRLVSPQVDSMVSGITKYMPDRLMTVDWIDGPPNWNCELTSPHRLYQDGHRWVNLNAWYEYRAPQWATWSHYNMTNPVMPTCIFETMYEGATDLGMATKSHPTSPLDMRGQEWGTVLNGGSGFGILGSFDALYDPLQWLGKNPGIEQGQYCTDFFTARHWYDLLPDWSHTFLTSQSGTPGSRDFKYVSAALTRDGSLGVCYYPGESGERFQLTVNMAKMGAGLGSSRARWYDPTDGTFRIIGKIANSGSHTFTTPGANSKKATDWVLVLEN
jgi:hypothetical protein